MFTGLIEEVGRVAALRRSDGSTRLEVSCNPTARELKTGDSVSVSGVCLTAVAVQSGKSFAAHLAQETLARTSLARLKVGTSLNLELPVKAGSRLGGHIVQGHIDGIAKLLSLAPVSHFQNRNKRKQSRQEDWWLRIMLPSSLRRYVVEKGSITVEGISLTVAKVSGGEVTIAIIPHTYENTNLHALQAGDVLNVEVDILAKYAEKARQSSSVDKASSITVQRLVAEGF